MKEKIISFKKTHPVIFAALAILIFDLFIVVVKLFYSLENRENIQCMIREGVLTVFAVAMIFVAGQAHIYKCGFKNLFRGLWSGFIIIAIALLITPVYITDGISSGAEFKSPVQIAAFIIFVLLVGAAEESVCRGIATDVLIEKFGKSKGGIWLAAVISGLFFGIFQITNLFSQSLSETIIQVIGTSLTGIFLSAIYIRHRNIYTVMLLHALFDFTLMSGDGFFKGKYILTPAVAAENYNFWFELGAAIAVQGVFVIIAFFILRPKIAKRIAENNRNA